MIQETYPEEYLDIDFLSNIIFEYLYNNSTDCYEIEKIDTKNINISDIKLILDKKRQKKLVNNIFNTNVRWLWRKRDSYMFKREVGIFSSNIELKIIQENDEEIDLKSPLNMNSLITFLLSELVITKKTTGILMNLMTVVINLDLLIDFINNYDEISSDFLELKNINSKLINVTISEHFFKTRILSEIISILTWDQLKSIIIQVAHTIAIIQIEYPGFRKNNLSIDTVFLYLKKPKNNSYRINSDEFVINDEGYEVKISVFNDAYIPIIADNNGISDSKKVLDNTYDILHFLEDILSQVTNNPNITDDIKKNIKSIISNIKKYDKNILLSNIIMTESFFNTNQNGGTKNKSRVIKGIRYLSNSDIFLKSENRNISSLPDSLSSLDSDFEKKYSDNNKSISMINPSMQMPINYSMPMNSGMPINPGMPMPMNPGMPMPNTQITNDQLVKLGIMPPMNSSSMSKTSADLSLRPQFNMQGGNNQDIYIDIANPDNFFF